MQGSLPSEQAALILRFSLVASGQIKLRRIDGWHQPASLAAEVLATMTRSTQSSSGREDEAAIFNKHDATVARRMYTPNADLVTLRGENYNGAAEMGKGLAAMFASRSGARRAPVTITAQGATGCPVTP